MSLDDALLTSSGSLLGSPLRVEESVRPMLRIGLLYTRRPEEYGALSKPMSDKKWSPP